MVLGDLAVNHYDSIKRQARQTRTYLGVLDTATNELLLGIRSIEPNTEIIKRIHF